VVLMMSESPGSVMASTLTRNSLPQAVPRSTLSAGQQQRQQETHKHWYMTQGGNSNSLPGWKHVYLEFNISLTLRGRKLQQLYCSKHTAASILQQAYCSKHTAASILQQGYCSKDTAARILQSCLVSKCVRKQLHLVAQGDTPQGCTMLLFAGWRQARSLQ
jgi:hypothetical protein